MADVFLAGTYVFRTVNLTPLRATQTLIKGANLALVDTFLPLALDGHSLSHYTSADYEQLTGGNSGQHQECKEIYQGSRTTPSQKPNGQDQSA